MLPDSYLSLVFWHFICSYYVLFNIYDCFNQVRQTSAVRNKEKKIDKRTSESPKEGGVYNSCYTMLRLFTILWSYRSLKEFQSVHNKMTTFTCLQRSLSFAALVSIQLKQSLVVSLNNAKIRRRWVSYLDLAPIQKRNSFNSPRQVNEMHDRDI